MKKTTTFAILLEILKRRGGGFCEIIHPVRGTKWVLRILFIAASREGCFAIRVRKNWLSLRHYCRPWIATRTQLVMTVRIKLHVFVYSLISLTKSSYPMQLRGSQVMHLAPSHITRQNVMKVRTKTNLLIYCFILRTHYRFCLMQLKRGRPMMHLPQLQTR